MSRIKSKDSAAEKAVRSIAHRLGYRYRLHRKDLPGTPDLVFTSKRKVIFVHGCYWHGHKCKRGNRTPKTNTDYWVNKIQNNKERDKKSKQALNKSGWDVLVIWECKTNDEEHIRTVVHDFLKQ